MLKSIVRLSLILSVAVYSGGPAWGACPKGDLNGDCAVDFEDVQTFAEQWLYPPASQADIDGLGGVDGRDFTILASEWYQTGIPLVINEVMASNSRTKTDPQGQYDDWIEIYNAGSFSIDTGGMHLTDELGNPTKWQIPAGNPALTTVLPGNYLLIWADNDQTDYPAGLHAGFELNADTGDEVGLFDCNGVYIDSVEFPDQTPDVSYGRYPDGNDTWRFFGTATPEATNIDAYLGQVADTKFSHNRGFYYSPFSATIATETEGAEIYYTLDGTSPLNLASEVPTGTRYINSIPINTTTFLRAVAVKPGWKPTNIDAETYIFPAMVLQQATNPSTGAQVVPAGYPTLWDSGTGDIVTGDYQIDPDIVNHATASNRFTTSDIASQPTISLVVNRDDFFGANGIYLKEALTYHVDQAPEKVASVEYIDTVRGVSEQANCAIAMAGGVSGGGTSLQRWKSYKLSMRPRFKTTTDYGTYTGGPSKFNFRLFPDSPVERFDTFVFDAVLNHSWLHATDATQRNTAMYIQDQYVADLHNAMGGYSPHGIYAQLYLNGLHWGMYYVHERPDHTWAAEMFGGEADEYDCIKHGSYMVNDSFGVVGNAFSNFNAMVAAASAVQSDPTNADKYDTVCRMLDIDNFITYILANWFTGNQDWVGVDGSGKNWYATRRNHPDGRWRVHSWDAEHTIEGDNQVGNSPRDIHDKLKGNAEYLMRFADIIHKNFFNNGVLLHPNPANMYQALMTKADRAIAGESARWGDNRQSTPYTRSNWLTTQNSKLSSFFPGRTATVFGWLRGAGLYPSIDAPVFCINGSYKHGGYISSTDLLSITAGAGTIYYTIDGNDPRVSPKTTSTILVSESVGKRVLVPTGDIDDNWKGGGAFNDSLWRIGNRGVGFETRPDDTINYVALIGIDVLTEMYDKNATCYVRIPFVVNENPATFDSLRLRMRYDDGFVAYINGIELAPRRNFTDTPTWSSNASSSRTDSLAVDFEDIVISSYIYTLRSGDNILAIHGVNRAANNVDFLISAELVAGKSGSAAGNVSPSAIEYTAPVTLDKSTHVKARLKSGSTWSALNEATYAVGPVAENLRITEIMYHPQETGNPDDPNEEFIELRNIGPAPMNLNLVRFTNGIDFTFPNRVLDSGAYVVVVAKESAFDVQYPGSGGVVAGEYTGRLDNASERIMLEDALGRTIHDFEYKDGWRNISDGQGFSLTIIDPTNPDPNSWGRKDSWRGSAYVGGSPGWDDSGIVPDPGAIVINELLAHSHAVAPDWIELYNTTDEDIDIAGWYLSDTEIDPKKYRFADGTKIGAYDYLVLYEDANFGEASTDPGRLTGLGFSENGDNVYLRSAEGGTLTGYREAESFGASYTGISFGRYFKRSTGSYNFVHTDYNTPGWSNAYPKVGPIVINEIMYNPDWPVGGNYSNDRYEYIELRNITAEPVTLYRFDKGLPWKFSEGIDFTFPAWPSAVMIPAGDHIVVVRDPNAFTWRYPGVPAAKVFGPYTGQLANDGEQVELSMPGDIDKYGRRHYIRIDRVGYSDGSHPEDELGAVDLWPTQADGGGKSLTRKAASLYGNDPNNWIPATPSPGG